MYTNILKAQQPPSDEVDLEAVKQTCDRCIWRQDGLRCDAFPDGIPPAILVGAFDHRYHFEDDTHDDQGVVFSPGVILTNSKNLL